MLKNVYIGDHVRISSYENIFAKGYVSNSMFQIGVKKFL